MYAIASALFSRADSDVIFKTFFQKKKKMKRSIIVNIYNI